MEKKEKITIKEQVDVNVEYDNQITNKVLDFEDEEVKNRWSRNIGVMGIEALKKQAQASVFLFNLSGLGVEIAKNIVLSGMKRLTIFDNQVTTYKDISG